MTHEQRFEFVVWPDSYRSEWHCSLGDYDQDAPTGHGGTPTDAIINWLEMHGDDLGMSNDAG